jgi:hypothetical protein
MDKTELLKTAAAEIAAAWLDEEIRAADAGLMPRSERLYIVATNILHRYPELEQVDRHAVIFDMAPKLRAAA